MTDGDPCPICTTAMIRDDGEVLCPRCRQGHTIPSPTSFGIPTGDPNERMMIMIHGALAVLVKRTDTQWDKDARDAAVAFIKMGSSTDPSEIAVLAGKVADGLEQIRTRRPSKEDVQ